MSMVRDDGGDRMVEEFRKAQLRRLANAITVKCDHMVAPQGDASGGVAVDRSTTASTSHSNG